MLYHYTLIKLRCFILAFSTRSENERPLISHASVERIKISSNIIREEREMAATAAAAETCFNPFIID